MEPESRDSSEEGTFLFVREKKAARNVVLKEPSLFVLLPVRTDEVREF